MLFYSILAKLVDVAKIFMKIFFLEKKLKIYTKELASGRKVVYIAIEKSNKKKKKKVVVFCYPKFLKIKHSNK